MFFFFLCEQNWASLTILYPVYMELSRSSCYLNQKEKSEWDRIRILEMLNEFNSTLQTWQRKIFVSWQMERTSSLFISMLNPSRMSRLINWLPWESLGLTSNSFSKIIYSFYWISSASVFLPSSVFALSVRWMTYPNT